MLVLNKKVIKKIAIKTWHRDSMARAPAIALIIILFLQGICYGASHSASRRARHVKLQGDHGASPSIKRRASLRGSRESQYRQNEQADKEDLQRIKDGSELQELKASGALVPLPENEFIGIDESEIDVRLRWCRPWTKEFLLDIGKGFHKQFGKKPRVTSAVRTIEDQRRLRKINRNAALPDGERASSHLTGSAIDIGKKGMTPKEMAWIRRELLSLEAAVLIEATEESRNQSNFHVMVFRNYKK